LQRVAFNASGEEPEPYFLSLQPTQEEIDEESWEKID